MGGKERALASLNSTIRAMKFTASEPESLGKNLVSIGTDYLGDNKSGDWLREQVREP